ncbi:hypothetical protein THAOC_07054, partial [Thalassiosira oceanica]
CSSRAESAGGARTAAGRVRRHEGARHPRRGEGKGDDDGGGVGRVRRQAPAAGEPLLLAATRRDRLPGGGEPGRPAGPSSRRARRLGHARRARGGGPRGRGGGGMVGPPDRRAGRRPERGGVQAPLLPGLPVGRGEERRHAAAGQGVLQRGGIRGRRRRDGMVGGRGGQERCTEVGGPGGRRGERADEGGPSHLQAERPPQLVGVLRRHECNSWKVPGGQRGDAGGRTGVGCC